MLRHERKYHSALGGGRRKERLRRDPAVEVGGINRHAVIWRDISCRKHFGYVFFCYVFFVTFFTLFSVTFFFVTFFFFSGDIFPYIL